MMDGVQGYGEVKIPEEVKNKSLYRECVRTARETYPEIVHGSQQEVNIAMDLYTIRLMHPEKDAKEVIKSKK